MTILKRQFGLFIKRKLQILLYATDEKDAWKKLKQAGIYNKGNVFELLDIETNKLDQIDKGLSKNMIKKIIEVKK